MPGPQFIRVKKPDVPKRPNKPSLKEAFARAAFYKQHKDLYYQTGAGMKHSLGTVAWNHNMMGPRTTVTLGGLTITG